MSNYNCICTTKATRAAFNDEHSLPFGASRLSVVKFSCIDLYLFSLPDALVLNPMQLGAFIRSSGLVRFAIQPGGCATRTMNAITNFEFAHIHTLMTQSLMSDETFQQLN